jgi:fused signal recognition particle receptor
MFSFFKKKSTAPAEAPIETPAAPPPDTETSASGGAMGWLRKSFGAAPADREAPADQEAPALPATTDSTPPTVALPTPKPEGERQGWMERLRTGLRKTGGSIATVFTGTKIDEALYEELEDALLMADTGVRATQHLLADLKRRVKETKTTEPAAVKALLADARARPPPSASSLGTWPSMARACCWRRPTPSAQRRASSLAFGPRATRWRSSARMAATRPP